MNQIVTSDCKYLKFNVPYRYFLVCADLWSGQIFVVTVCSWQYHDGCWRKILDFDVYTAKKLFPKKQFHLRLLYSQCFEALIRVRNLPIDLRKGRPYKTLQIFISLIFFVFFCFFCSANKPLKRHGGSGNSRKEKKKVNCCLCSFVMAGMLYKTLKHINESKILSMDRKIQIYGQGSEV